MKNHQVRIRDRQTGKVIWVNGGYTSATEAERAAEVQLIFRDRSRYDIEVETI